jgi:hypothetical protein
LTGLSFKDVIRSDIGKVFVNIGEFAEQRLVDGVPMRVIEDANELEERQKSTVANRATDGTYKAQVLLYIPVEDYGPKPKAGKLLNLDNRKTFIIRQCTEEGGIYAMTLEVSRA